ncbi:hypothetical protein H8Z60_23865 [Mycolicibacterium fortuitum]|nr:hypothetical protein [Mycolicibacterium fortuitum]
METKEIIPVSCSDGDLMTEAREALPYWLRKYAHEANEACYWKGQADITKEALARLQCDYQADKQRFHDRARELSEEKERVKELEQALDKPRSHLWFELTNERAKHRSAKERYRSLHNLHDEQRARASEYYNEMLAEKERAEKAEERHNGLLKVVQEATEYMSWRDEGNGPEIALKIIYKWLEENPVPKEETK